jgi:hypothetical protein
MAKASFARPRDEFQITRHVINNPDFDSNYIISRTHSHAAEPCLEWIGVRDRFGYGRVGSELAHRISWERTNGEIPSESWACSPSR